MPRTQVAPGPCVFPRRESPVPRVTYLLPCLILLVTGCNSNSAASPTATPTSAPTTVSTCAPRATPTVTTVNATYLAFVRTICGSLQHGDSKAIQNSLMYYQYNSGLRWGMMGDGEGNTSDPGLVGSWLARARPHCVSYSPGTGGHGVLLTVGWGQPGPASLIEADLLNGHWKINDFTFGRENVLAQAMQVGDPILQYHA